MTARLLSQWMTWGMDFVALMSLYATSEIHPLTIVCVPSLLLISIILKTQIAKPISKLFSTRVFLISFTIAVIVVTLVLWLKFHLPLIVAVASTAPIIHGSLWLISEDASIARTAQLRLALGFIELIITAILTADVFLTLSLFLFTLLAATSISCQFLERAAAENKDQIGTLNSKYLVNVIRTAFLVLLSAAILFPILPRARISSGIDASNRQAGYTEKVTLDRMSKLYGTRGGRTLMTFYRSEDSKQKDDPTKKKDELSTLIHLGLVRAKTLSVFDGTRWSVGSEDPDTKPPFIQKPNTSPLIWLQVDRESIESEALPSPYGTSLVVSRENTRIAKHTSSGEWLSRTAFNSRIQYRVGIQNDSVEINYGSGFWDKPTPEESAVPPQLETPALKRLEEKIFGQINKKNMDPEFLVSKLRGFFARNSFTTSTESTPIDSKLPPIIDFLLVNKNGNCELFASSAAVLLRRIGIPTRLVTGFRISRGAKNDILQIKTGDAHAWLEYWIDSKGWRIFDPTPRTELHLNFFDYFQEAYDSLESIWYRYAYSYDAGTQGEISYRGISKFQDLKQWTLTQSNWMGLLRNLEETGKWTLLGGGVFLILLVIFFSFGLSEFSTLLLPNKNEGSFRLRYLRKKMERIIKPYVSKLAKNKSQLQDDFDVIRLDSFLKQNFDQAIHQAYFNWKNHYQEARFGKWNPVQDADSQSRMKKLLAEISDDEIVLKNLLRSR